MKTNCPHCRKPLEAPDAQADLQCPHCRRYFLWIPASEDETESDLDQDSGPDIESETDFSTPSPDRFHSEPLSDPRFAPSGRSAGLASTSEPVNSDEFAGKIEENVSGSLYGGFQAPAFHSSSQKNGTHNGASNPNERVSLYSSTYLKSGTTDELPNGEKKRNMYPYELPGQTIEADRRMPVYTSMMADAYHVFECNVPAAVASMIVFSILFLAGTLVYASFLTLVWQLVRDMTFAPGVGIYAMVAGVSLVYAIYIIWVFNGQCRYYVELLRYGKTSARLMFAGFPGLIRTCIVWLILGVPLLAPLGVAGYFYLGYLGDYGYLTELDVQKIHQILGAYYPAATPTRLIVGASAAVVGIIVFLFLKLYLGIAYWLIIDKDLDLIEALSVSVKITKEKKGTFLAIIISCFFAWLGLTTLTFGMGATLLFPIILLFIAMYYMKTNIQEMVIPGKSSGTIENPRVGLYDYDQNNYNKKVESKDSDEVDIL